MFTPKHSKAPQSQLYPHLMNDIQSELSAGGATWKNTQNVPAQTESWPKDSILGLASRRPASASFQKC